MCTKSKIVKLWLENGEINLVLDTGEEIAAAPENWIKVFHGESIESIYRNRVSLYVIAKPGVSTGGYGFSYRAPDEIRDKDGNRITSPVTTLDDVKAYFISLGMGSQPVADLSNYYNKGEVDEIVAQIYEAIGQPVPTPQLAAPVPVASGVTENSVMISFPAVPNATSYEYRQNGTLVYSGAQTSRTFTGLNPDTMYTYSIIAKANGYLNSLTGSVTATTEDDTPPVPGNTQFPYTFPFTLS